MLRVESRYIDGKYFTDNPDWDRRDSFWKAQHILRILNSHKITPLSIGEVGCGSGDMLLHLATGFPRARIIGYDISPQLTEFWRENSEASKNICFKLGDFHLENRERFDVLLMCDVFEHVRDPFTFLESSLSHAEHFVFHIPLDLSAISVARMKPLMDVRRKFGHLHSYTKDIALATLRDCGYRIIDWKYTDACFSVPNRSWRTRFASGFRRLAFFLNKDVGVRLLGGETLIVLARQAGVVG